MTNEWVALERKKKCVGGLKKSDRKASSEEKWEEKAWDSGWVACVEGVYR